MTSTRPTVAVGMVGHAFMGAAHSQAWRTAPRFFDLPLVPTMQVVCGRDAIRVSEAAQRLGWAEAETDWRRLVERPDIGLVDICTPGDTHADRRRRRGAARTRAGASGSRRRGAG